MNRAQLEQLVGGPLLPWQLAWCTALGLVEPFGVRCTLDHGAAWILLGRPCPECGAAR